WTLYQAYGDIRILEQQYESVKACVDYETSKADEDGVWREGTGFEGELSHFGDWLAYSTENAEFPGATTDKDLIATAYYAYSSNTLSKITAIIGKSDDEKKYKAQYEKIKRAFKTEFITSSGRLSSNTQTAYVLALSFGLIPDELIESSAAYLAKDVDHLKHLTTGFLGTPLLMQALCDAGYEDLAFMLINRKVFPSWLYPVTLGATTIWERWDSQRPDGTFNGDTMNSFNHYAYGAVGSWLYNYVAGIRIDENISGYKRIIIKPTIGGGLTFASSTHESMYGTISSSWKIENGKVTMQVEVPANTTAVVYALNAENEYEKHEIGSGKYTFIR
ncbi:MAG: alpha-L-rhamnosidase, partial [Bacteroidales bacterium]|nr:alpha-L-rhamnosidase [Bacteroidales bacterium]